MKSDIMLIRFSIVIMGMVVCCTGQVVFDDGGDQFPNQQRRPQSLPPFQQGNGQQGQNFNGQGSGFGGNRNPGFGQSSASSLASSSSSGSSSSSFGGGFGNGNGQNFGNGQGFGNGQNFGNGQSGQNFGNGQGFGNGNGFVNQGGQSSQFQQDLAARSPDCETFNREGGICTPLNNCERIGRMLRNRAPFAAARLLRRSICGFNNAFLPNVCCPLGRNQDRDNSLGNGNEFPPQTSPTTTRPQTFTTQRFQPTFSTQPPPLQTTTINPFGSGGGVGVTLIPPKTTTVGGGGGLIIIGPTSSPGGGGGGTSPGLSDVGLPSYCGFSNASHTRIVGGHPASKGAWPWIAALGYKDDAGNVNFLCGGALISKDFVVTASHCVYKRNDLMTIRLGDYDLFSNSDGVDPLDMEIAEVIMHPKYESGTFYNDIALIRLKRSVPFTRQIHPICLPSTPQLRNNRFEDNTPFVAGWGAIEFNGPSTSYLKEVQLPIVPDSVCQEKFKTFKSVNVDDTNICAGLAKGGQDACQGDSGGPLMQPVGNNKYVLIGIVSFGFKCAEPGYPGVYSRITTHLSWIERTINS